MKYFDPVKLGFLDDRYDKISKGAKPETEWSLSFGDLMNGQSSGKCIKADDNGLPVLVVRHLTDKQLEDGARASRDAAIAESMWLAERHRGQVSMGMIPTLTEDQYSALLEYHQTLRDWPAQPGWPHIELPVKPEWLQ